MEHARLRTPCIKRTAQPVPQWRRPQLLAWDAGKHFFYCRSRALTWGSFHRASLSVGGKPEREPCLSSSESPATYAP